jgi:hypothetical protein
MNAMRHFHDEKSLHLAYNGLPDRAVVQTSRVVGILLRSQKEIGLLQVLCPNANYLSGAGQQLML